MLGRRRGPGSDFDSAGVVADRNLEVMESPDLWQRYVDPAFRHAAPVGLSEWRREMRVRIEPRVVLRTDAVRPRRSEHGRAGGATRH